MMVLFNFKKMRKGEISTSTIIGFVILLVGLVIIFLFYYKFGWAAEIDDQVCHESVIARGTVSQLTTLLQDTIPLQCETSKLCLTSGIIGGTCDDDFHKSGDVEKVKVDSLDEIEKVISDEVVSCWNMMGQGKLSLFDQYLAKDYGLGSVYPTCVICTRIAFDEKLSVSETELKFLDVFDYMENTNVPGKEITYSEYLLDEHGKFSADSVNVKTEIVDGKLNPDDKGEVLTGNSIKVELVDNPAEEMAIVFMQISAPGHAESALNIGEAALGFGVGSAYFFGPVATISGIGKIGGTALKGGIWTIALTAIAGIYQQGNVAFQRYVAAGYCTDVFEGTSGDQARNGCSVVRAIKYNETEINKYCDIIEGLN